LIVNKLLSLSLSLSPSPSPATQQVKESADVFTGIVTNNIHESIIVLSLSLARSLEGEFI